jgi:hypothetical protein
MVPCPTNRPIAALFVRKNSIYKTFPDVDCYDAARDALTWPGGCPVIAHPPCRTWGCLKAFAKAPRLEHNLAIWAIQQVRRWGGVLEHPQGTTLFKQCGCALLDGLPDEWGGRTFRVDQFHWGHLARKRTILYVVGLWTIPGYQKKPGQPTMVIDNNGTARRLKRARGETVRPALSHNLRDVTPPEFARWLVALARACKAQEP